MGKIDYKEIELDKPGSTYTPGETVTGKFIFKVKERLKINAVKVKIVGEAHVHW